MNTYNMPLPYKNTFDGCNCQTKLLFKSLAIVLTLNSISLLENHLETIIGYKMATDYWLHFSSAY